MDRRLVDRGRPARPPDTNPASPKRAVAGPPPASMRVAITMPPSQNQASADGRLLNVLGIIYLAKIIRGRRQRRQVTSGDAGQA